MQKPLKTSCKDLHTQILSACVCMPQLADPSTLTTGGTTMSALTVLHSWIAGVAPGVKYDAVSVAVFVIVLSVVPELADAETLTRIVTSTELDDVGGEVARLIKQLMTFPAAKVQPVGGAVQSGSTPAGRVSWMSRLPAVQGAVGLLEDTTSS